MIDCTPSSIIEASKCYCGLTSREDSSVSIYLLCQWANSNPTPPPAGCGTPSHIIQISGAGTVGANQVYVELPPPDAGVFVASNGWTVTCVTGTISDFPSADVIYESSSIYDPIKLCPCDWVIGTGLGSNPAPIGQYLASSPEMVWNPSSALATWADSGGPHVGDLATFLATADLPTVSSIDLAGTGLLTIVGLQTLPSLSSLVLSNNSLGYLDVSGCTALTTLNCSSNPSLTTLTLTGCAALTTLDCSLCDIKPSLDVSPCAASLDSLFCSSNANLTSINLSSCTVMTTLGCDSCNITGPLNLSGLISLVSINAGTNPNITGCDITLDTLVLYCYFNNCSVPVSDVNATLINLDVNGLNGGEVDMSGQTPAAPPSGAGLVSKNNLLAVGRGPWSVVTD